MADAKEQKIIAWLRLVRTPNIGPVTFYKLLEQYKNAQEAINQLQHKYDICSEEEARAEITKAQKLGVHIICRDDEFYPPRLKEIEDCPPILYVRGNPEILKFPLAVSIVGARNASVTGRKIASRIAYDLTNADVVVVSGMARGIDAAGHKGAMYAKNQAGPTIAVLGTGVDEIYPAENKELYEQIISQGAIISEFALGTKAQAPNFPRRNRIVAAMSCATLVVEATTHSGSLITAKMALEQGRDVFAVPGSPFDDRSGGPNMLIKEGAYLTESADDILKVIAIGNHQKIKTYKNEVFKDIVLDNEENNDDIPLIKIKNSKLCADQKAESSKENIEREGKDMQIVDGLLTPQGVYVDDIIRASGLSLAEVSMRLLELEMEGAIERQPGNKVALIKKKR